MYKKTLIIFFSVILLFITIIFFIKNNSNLSNDIQEKLIYFYSKRCPHCANVEKFFEENKIENKFKFDKKEVGNNIKNAKLLSFIAKSKCKINTNQIGVPFLWDGKNSKCILGDEPIIEYFEKLIIYE